MRLSARNARVISVGSDSSRVGIDTNPVSLTLSIHEFDHRRFPQTTRRKGGHNPTKNRCPSFSISSSPRIQIEKEISRRDDSEAKSQEDRKNRSQIPEICLSRTLSIRDFSTIKITSRYGLPLFSSIYIYIGVRLINCVINNNFIYIYIEKLVQTAAFVST